MKPAVIFYAVRIFGHVKNDNYIARQNVKWKTIYAEEEEYMKKIAIIILSIIMIILTHCASYAYKQTKTILKAALPLAAFMQEKATACTAPDINVQ